MRLNQNKARNDVAASRSYRRVPHRSNFAHTHKSNRIQHQIRTQHTHILQPPTLLPENKTLWIGRNAAMPLRWLRCKTNIYFIPPVIRHIYMRRFMRMRMCVCVCLRFMTVDKRRCGRESVCILCAYGTDARAGLCGPPRPWRQRPGSACDHGRYRRAMAQYRRVGGTELIIA